ncbi:helix-turn-helix transcriptional regulator [Paenibacillus rigui]|uniref:AraC family transcriptional regulator n=1 Tax=Paenibacillus rigui TaxID=554312 RepID=A0A229UQF8_9BACL|nr:helix-turn-helix transcriptional regulator [Paenibacillus rigui]OXM85563.1 AraC family transcriptional regulator [Paenibacillus rigui]
MIECLELALPPTPFLMTVGRYRPVQGTRHYERTFPLYDIILVKQGAYYMVEDGVRYDIKENGLLVLEPDKLHAGSAPCPEGTELYYVHLKHPRPLRTLRADEISWSALLSPSPSYHDLDAGSQRMYLPKFAHLDLSEVFPLLDRMMELKSQFSLENQLPLQALAASLCVQLQRALRAHTLSPGQKLSEQLIAYLYACSDRPFRLDDLSEQFHFHVDYLSKCLKKHTGLTPLQYSNRIKIEKAKSMLQQTDLPLKEIVNQLGIADYNYFLRLFRKHTGVSPGKYRYSFQQ